MRAPRAEARGTCVQHGIPRVGAFGGAASAPDAPTVLGPRPAEGGMLGSSSRGVAGASADAAPKQDPWLPRPGVAVSAAQMSDDAVGPDMPRAPGQINSRPAPQPEVPVKAPRRWHRRSRGDCAPRPRCPHGTVGPWRTRATRGAIAPGGLGRGASDWRVGVGVVNSPPSVAAGAS